MNLINSYISIISVLLNELIISWFETELYIILFNKRNPKSVIIRIYKRIETDSRVKFNKETVIGYIRGQNESYIIVYWLTQGYSG